MNFLIWKVSIGLIKRPFAYLNCHWSSKWNVKTSNKNSSFIFQNMWNWLILNWFRVDFTCLEYNRRLFIQLFEYSGLTKYASQILQKSFKIQNDRWKLGPAMLDNFLLLRSTIFSNYNVERYLPWYLLLYLGGIESPLPKQGSFDKNINLINEELRFSISPFIKVVYITVLKQFFT